MLGNLGGYRCNGITLNDLESPVVNWAQVLGSYLCYMGGVPYMGNPGISVQGTSPRLSHPSCKARSIAAIPNPNATNKVSDNDNVHHGQTY